MVCCSWRIWLVEHSCFYRCYVGFAVSILVYLIQTVLGGLGATLPVLQSSSWSESDDIGFCCVCTKQREKILLISRTRIPPEHQEERFWAGSQCCCVPVGASFLTDIDIWALLFFSVRSAVPILFYWWFGSLWFGGKITGIAIVVMAGERWQRFLVACVQAKGGCRLIRTLLLTTLSSSTTSCFGLHAYGATWNLEGKKFNLCNWTLIRETYWRKAASNFQ